MSDDKKKSFLGKSVKIILKLLFAGGIVYVSALIGFIADLSFSASGISGFNSIVIWWGALLVPGLLIPLLFVKNKRKVLKYWGVFALAFGIVFAINVAMNTYDESIKIDTNPNINCSEYLPFTEKSKIVKLDHGASLKLEDNLPIVDGAAAVFPVYSAFVNATYPNTVELYDGVFEYNNTVGGYKLLAEKETDIFFGAYPSQVQIDDAFSKGTEFEYTEIGKDAFVFFVHKDNPIENLTTEQIQKIYSGKITNWKEVGGKNEEIVAFQRNEGSGSQSMLVRFMGNKKIMKAPSEQVNDLMSGIVERVSTYRNKTSSIGFSFRYYLDGIIKNPDIKMLSIDGVAPTVENIKAGKYPVTTSLYAVTYKDHPNVNVDKLIQWVLSEEGQEIIEKTGYVGVAK